MFELKLKTDRSIVRFNLYFSAHYKQVIDKEYIDRLFKLNTFQQRLMEQESIY